MGHCTPAHRISLRSRRQVLPARAEDFLRRGVDLRPLPGLALRAPAREGRAVILKALLKPLEGLLVGLGRPFPLAGWERGGRILLARAAARYEEGEGCQEARESQGLHSRASCSVAFAATESSRPSCIR